MPSKTMPDFDITRNHELPERVLERLTKLRGTLERWITGVVLEGA